SHRLKITGSWDPTKDNPELTREEETALARFRTGASHRYGWLLRKIQTHIPPGCRWCNPQQVNMPAPVIPTSQKQPRYALNKATDPATCTECGTQYSCRNTAVVHMVNKHMGSREPTRSGRSNSPMSRLRRTSRQNPRRHHNPHLRPQRYPVPIRPKAKPHPFACSMCKRTFPLQNGLTRHLRYMRNAPCHVPERKRPRADEPIQRNQRSLCDKCDMIARSKTGLKAHIRARHPENPPKNMHLASNSFLSLLHYDANFVYATLATLELSHAIKSSNIHLEPQFCQQQYK
ncbi:Tbingi protein, partial [Trypanosoma theileri]